jgi:Cu(I)/Ag(I) efflux system membrane fusion protein
MPEVNEMTPETPANVKPSGRHFSLGAVVAIALATAAVGAGVSYLARLPAHGTPEGATAGAPTAPAAPKEQYQCPMHPTIVQDHPGDCPICGMKLVKVAGGADAKAHADEAHGASTVEGLATVDIDPSRQQLIGLTTAAVTRGPVGGSWRTVGRVAVDETRIHHVNVKISGFISHTHGSFVGMAVKKGEPLFRIYSPELLAAEDEYVLALGTRNTLRTGGSRSSDGDELVASARRKLELWDVPEGEIARLERGGKPMKDVTFYAPATGVITKKDMVDGMRVAAGEMPFEMVDLSRVWVLADVYETELRHVKMGMPATLTLKAYPNRIFKGRVAFIDPLLNPKTRTVTVRLEFANPTGELKPEMFGEVVLQGASREGLRVPADSVIDSGTKSVVFVSVGEGKFQPREVRLGDSDGTHVEVASGVAEDEKVVTRANFLIDSESRLRASLAALGAGSAPAGHDHAGAAAPSASVGAGMSAAAAADASEHGGH